MSYQDLLFILFLLLLSIWYLFSQSNQNSQTRFDYQVIWGLFVYHLVFSLIFHGYMLENGGDSISYWNLDASKPQGEDTWSSYQGTGTAFIQWFNYPFSQWAGLGFLSGNLLYACISFLGFVGAFDLIKDQFQEKWGSWPGKYGLLILFLPNVHFWTAGVGKAALLFPGLVLVLLGVKSFPARAWFIVPGLLLSLFVRPIQGLVLTIAVLAVLPFHPALKTYRRKLLPGAAGLILAIFAYRWIQGSLVYGFNFEWIGRIIDWQNAYLSSFEAGSTIPMGDYSLPEKFMAVWFRPYLWEVKGFWTFAAALENTFFFMAVIFGIWRMIKSKLKVRIPLFYLVVLIYAAIMSLIFILALNNLGILMRMKSIFVIFVVSFFLSQADRSFKSDKSIL